MSTQPEVGSASEPFQITETEPTHDELDFRPLDEPECAGNRGTSNPTKALTRMAAGIAHEICHPAEVIRSNGETVGDYLTVLATLVSEYAGLVEAFGGHDNRAITEHQHRIKQLREAENVPFVLDDVKVVLRESHDSIARLQKLAGRLNELSRDDDLAEATDLTARIDETVRPSKAA